MSTAKASRTPDPPPAPAREPTWREQERFLLGDVMKLIGRSLSPEAVFREMLHLLSEMMGLNRGRIVLLPLDDDPAQPAARAGGDEATIRYAYGLTRLEISHGHYARGEGITGAVLATGHPIIVQNIDADPRFLFRAVPRHKLPQETVSFLALPIELERRTVGVLAVHRLRRRNRPLNDDLALLKILATMAGQLLQLQALVADKTRELAARNMQLERALDSSAARYGIIGRSPALLRALEQLERVSNSQATVLLLGESGSGKELFARALHLASPRRDAPFIKVNCAAIPETLFESELFGHERGAFTGATNAREGWFEQADRGTIFLDELGEMPLALQAKLLRTLQEGTITRLGGKRETSVDVRVVAATNLDLAAEVAHGKFRQDLFYRLSVIPIHLPSLAERLDDIRPLALHFLNKTNQVNKRNVHLSTAALEALEQHPWPGNIRELGNVIERLVLLTDQTVVTGAEMKRLLPRTAEKGGRQAAANGKAHAKPEADTLVMPASVRQYLDVRSHAPHELLEALDRHGGNQSRAAQSLGLTVRQFGYRLKRIAAAG